MEKDRTSEKIFMSLKVGTLGESKGLKEQVSYDRKIKGKKLDESKDNDKKVYYFMVGICLDENRPDAEEDEFFDMPDFGIPYKLMDENYGVTKTLEEAVGYVEKYVSSGVAGTFGVVVCADEPFEGFKDNIEGGFNDGLDFNDITHFKENGGELLYCAYSTQNGIKTLEDRVTQNMGIESGLSVKAVSSINKLYDFVSDRENRKLFNSDGIDEELVDLLKKLTNWNKYKSKEELIKDVDFIIKFVYDNKEYFHDSIDEEIIDYLKDIKEQTNKGIKEQAENIGYGKKIKGPTLDKDFNYYCEWCGSKFKATPKEDGTMPNCPTCYKKRYKDDPERDADGHANKDVHLVDPTSKGLKESDDIRPLTKDEMEKLRKLGRNDLEIMVGPNTKDYYLYSNSIDAYYPVGPESKYSEEDIEKLIRENPQFYINDAGDWLFGDYDL